MKRSLINTLSQWIRGVRDESKIKVVNSVKNKETLDNTGSVDEKTIKINDEYSKVVEALIMKFGIYPVLVSLKFFEMEENFDKCADIHKTIKYANDKFESRGIPEIKFPEQLNDDWFDDYIQLFHQNGISVNVASSNFKEYVRQVCFNIDNKYNKNSLNVFLDYTKEINKF